METSIPEKSVTTETTWTAIAARPRAASTHRGLLARMAWTAPKAISATPLACAEESRQLVNTRSCGGLQEIQWEVLQRL